MIPRQNIIKRPSQSLATSSYRLPRLTCATSLEPSLAPVVRIYRVPKEISRVVMLSRLEVAHTGSDASEGCSDVRNGSFDATRLEAGIGENFRPGIRAKATSPPPSQQPRGLVRAPQQAIVRRWGSPPPQKGLVASVPLPSPALAPGAGSSTSTANLKTAAVLISSGSAPDVGTLRPCPTTRCPHPREDHYDRIPSPLQRTNHTGTPCVRVFLPPSVPPRSQQWKNVPPSPHSTCRPGKRSTAVNRVSKTCGHGHLVATICARAPVRRHGGCRSPGRTSDEIEPCVPLLSSQQRHRRHVADDIQ